MSRGVVLRPDASGCAAVAQMWAQLKAAGVPSGPDSAHGLHVPHVSLTVAEHLDVDEVRACVGVTSLVPSPAISFEALGLFPGGVLHLVPRPDDRLLEVQRAAHRACTEAPSTVGWWPYFEPGFWAPHLTLGLEVEPRHLVIAAGVVLPSLPLELTGWAPWVEDGTTGDA